MNTDTPTDETKAKKASKKKPKPTANAAAPKIPDHREDIQAPYTFTPEEIAAMNVKLRGSLNAVELLEDQKKSAMQDFKLRIQNEENEARRLRIKLDAGEETRPLRAAVEFFAKRGMKAYLHPETGAFIREEVMQPADWQLPLFKKETVETKKPAPNGASPEQPPAPKGKSKAPATNEPGQTSVGVAIDAAAAGTEQPPIIIEDFDRKEWERDGLTKAMRVAAKKAGWPEAAISTLRDRMRECDSLESAKETLRPHVAPEAPKE